jgi:hypothetical protein
MELKCNATASRTTLKVLEVYFVPIYEIREEQGGKFSYFLLINSFFLNPVCVEAFT